jgi:hypothetical protein
MVKDDSRKMESPVTIWITNTQVFTEAGYNYFVWLHQNVKVGDTLRFYGDKKAPMKVTAIVEKKNQNAHTFTKVRTG